jgi:hypothetical protein
MDAILSFGMGHIVGRLAFGLLSDSERVSCWGWIAFAQARITLFLKSSIANRDKNKV